jgi:endoglucanase
VLGKDFVYPNENEFAYFQSKGLKVVRLPVKWERVQPMIGEDFDESNINEIDRCVRQANAHGLIVLLDIHNYAQRSINGKNESIGSPQLSLGDFNDLWVRLANRYKNNLMVWFGLMNEPHVQSAPETASIMQSALNAIRATGAQNRILAPGAAWTGALSWISSGNGDAYSHFQDPGNNFVFEVHQYLDSDGSGTKPEAILHSGSTRLEAFTKWARTKHVKAFLGESGWDGNPSNAQAEMEGEALLGFLDQNRDVWTGYTIWAAGPLWGNYMYSVEPKGLKEGHPIDSQQMKIILQHLQ